MEQCLYCYKPLQSNEIDFHGFCSRKIFGKTEPPILPYREEQMLELGEMVIKSHTAVAGVQPKLSLDITKIDFDKRADASQRFTIVGLWGSYILKPPTQQYPYLPELEDLTMHLATVAGIETVPHSLIRLQSGNLAYITKRVDRTKKSKLHMEDMCQLTERHTEDKYKGSYEQIAKAILKYSYNPVLDLINFYEQVLFSFLTGNADMHLKNFSLLKTEIGYKLAPAYDMVASALVVQGDDEEMALNLNGKKRKIQRKDFDALFSGYNAADAKAVQSIYSRFSGKKDLWCGFIESSFIPAEMKTRYIDLINKRMAKLEL
jgi:serine/threonine-protein kinase HipA